MPNYHKILCSAIAITGVFILLIPPSLAANCTCSDGVSDSASVDNPAACCSFFTAHASHTVICDAAPPGVTTSSLCKCSESGIGYAGKTQNECSNFCCPHGTAYFWGADSTSIVKVDCGTASVAGGTAETSAESTPGKVNLENPLSGVTSPTQLIGNIIKTILTIVGALALAMFVYGGFTWLTSGGSAERIKKGKDILVWAVIGLVVIFASYTAVDFVLTALGV